MVADVLCLVFENWVIEVSGVHQDSQIPKLLEVNMVDYLWQIESVNFAKLRVDPITQFPILGRSPDQGVDIEVNAERIRIGDLIYDPGSNAIHLHIDRRVLLGDNQTRFANPTIKVTNNTAWTCDVYRRIILKRVNEVHEIVVGYPLIVGSIPTLWLIWYYIGKDINVTRNHLVSLFPVQPSLNRITNKTAKHSKSVVREDLLNQSGTVFDKLLTVIKIPDV